MILLFLVVSIPMI